MTELDDTVAGTTDDTLTFDLRRQALAYLLRRVHARADAITAQVMVPDDMTGRQLTLLVASTQRPGATVSELAEDIAVDFNTTAAMVRRVVEKGLLERRRSKTDQRAWTLQITPRGADVVREALPKNDEATEAILAPLPEEYRQLFVKCLRLMLGLEEGRPREGEPAGDGSKG